MGISLTERHVIAVTYLDEHLFDGVKQRLLLFDQVAIVAPVWNRDRLSREQWMNLEWLMNQGLLFEAKLIDDPRRLSHIPQFEPLDLPPEGHPSVVDFINTQKYKLIRYFSALLERPQNTETEVVPTYDSDTHCEFFRAGDLDHGDPSLVSSRTVNVVLKAMPEPAENTPLESIVEFRNDPDSKRRLRALRLWMRKVPTERRANEIRDELESLLFDYQQHMKMHRMKVNKGTLETVLTIGGGVAEDLLKVRFRDLVGGLFIARERKLKLLEAELQSPGREVAYVFHSHEKFPTE